MTKIPLNNERFDTDGMHDNVTNRTRLTATTAGIYFISGNAEWASSPTSGLIRVLLNNTTVIAVSRIISADYRIMNVATIYELAASDYVELQILQASGGPINALSSGNYSPEFMMNWVAPPS